MKPLVLFVVSSSVCQAFVQPPTSSHAAPFLVAPLGRPMAAVFADVVDGENTKATKSTPDEGSNTESSKAEEVEASTANGATWSFTTAQGPHYKLSSAKTKEATRSFTTKATWSFNFTTAQGLGNTPRGIQPPAETNPESSNQAAPSTTYTAKQSSSSESRSKLETLTSGEVKLDLEASMKKKNESLNDDNGMKGADEEKIETAAKLKQTLVSLSQQKTELLEALGMDKDVNVPTESQAVSSNTAATKKEALLDGYDAFTGSDEEEIETAAKIRESLQSLMQQRLHLVESLGMDKDVNASNEAAAITAVVGTQSSASASSSEVKKTNSGEAEMDAQESMNKKTDSRAEGGENETATKMKETLQSLVQQRLQLLEALEMDEDVNATMHAQALPSNKAAANTALAGRDLSTSTSKSKAEKTSSGKAEMGANESLNKKRGSLDDYDDLQLLEVLGVDRGVNATAQSQAVSSNQAANVSLLTLRRLVRGVQPSVVTQGSSKAANVPKSKETSSRTATTTAVSNKSPRKTTGAFWVNEPFGEVNPIFSKIRPKKVIVTPLDEGTNSRASKEKCTERQSSTTTGRRSSARTRTVPGGNAATVATTNEDLPSRAKGAFWVNEPFGQANPIFSRMRQNRIISPEAAVVAEGGDVAGRETPVEGARTKTSSRARVATTSTSRAARVSSRGRQPSTPSRTTTQTVSYSNKATTTTRPSEGPNKTSGWINEPLSHSAATPTTPTEATANPTGASWINEPLPDNKAATTSTRKPPGGPSQATDPSWINEPFGQVNPIVSKMHQPTFSTPGKGVVAEGGDTLSQQSSKASTRRGVDITKASKAKERTTSTTKAARAPEPRATTTTKEMPYSTTARRPSSSGVETVSSSQVGTTKTATTDEASSDTAEGQMGEDDPVAAACYVSTTRTFVADGDGEAADAATRTFVAGAAASDDPIGDVRVGRKDSAASGAKDRKGKGLASSYESEILSEAFADVGVALAGCGDALIEDTKTAREALTNWMMLSPAWWVSGGAFTLFEELVVAAIAALVVRNAAKIQEAIINDAQAASRYEQDGWWGDFVSERERQSDTDEAKTKKSETAKKVVVKVMKESYVGDLLGKRSFVYEPQAAFSRNYFTEKTLSSKIPPSAHEVQQLQHEVKEVLGKEMREEILNKVPETTRQVTPPRAETAFSIPTSSSEEFRHNHMLDLTFVPSESLKDPFVMDILKKRKIVHGPCACC